MSTNMIVVSNYDTKIRFRVLWKSVSSYTLAVSK